jgi:acetyl-CoA acetyltransferase
MNDVIIAGIGQTPVGEHWDLSLRELALLALEQARQDSGNLQPQALYVEICWRPSFPARHTGSMIVISPG